MRAIDQYHDTHALSYLSDLGGQNAHRSRVSKLSQDIFRDCITKFYAIVDANPLLKHTFDRGFIELIDIA